MYGYVLEQQQKELFKLCNIYILSVFTEKPYRKSMALNVVYNPITTLSHTMLMTSK